MSNELSKIKAKILALSLKTVDRGCTEEEAVSAMEKVGELLEVYNLTLAEVHVADERCIQDEVYIGCSRVPAWAHMFVAVGSFTQVKVWTSLPYIRFFGFEPDVQMAIYLSRTILAAMKTEADRFKASDVYRRSVRRRRMTNSFYLGFARRVNERLTPAKPKAFGQQIVLAKSSMVETEFRRQNPELELRRVPSRTRSVNIKAYEAGNEAGDRVNINRPLGGTTNEPMRLIA